MMIEEPKSEQHSGVDVAQASDDSIVKTHERIRHTPIPGSPVLFFTTMALIVVVVFGWFHLRRYSGEYNPQMYLRERDDIALYRDWQNRPRGPIVYDYFAIGESLYTKMACVGCHMPDGMGKPGEFPPLAGSRYVTHEDASLPTKILLAGMVGPVTVKGAEYNGNMAAFGPALKDHEIAGLVTYIRKSWGNEGGEVTLEDVAAVRSEVGTRDPWKAEELQSYFD